MVVVFLFFVFCCCRRKKGRVTFSVVGDGETEETHEDTFPGSGLCQGNNKSVQFLSIFGSAALLFDSLFLFGWHKTHVGKEFCDGMNVVKKPAQKPAGNQDFFCLNHRESRIKKPLENASRALCERMLRHF